MNHRWTAVVLGIGLSFGGYAHGQAAIPSAVRSATTISDTERNAISGFIQAQTDKLSGKVPAAQNDARDAPVGAVVGGELPASAQFADAYAQALNDALMPLADDPSMPTRLNTAIVVGRIAERTQSLRLKPVVIKLLGDKCDPVVLWAVKATKALLPMQLKLRAASDDPMLVALVPAVQDNLAGPVTQMAYEALRLNLQQDRGNVSQPMLQIVVPRTHELLKARLALYKDGFPDTPVVDTLATSFLIDAQVWRAESEQERTTTAQLITDMLTFASRRAAAMTDPADGPDRDDIVQAINLLGSAVTVVAEAQNKPALKEAASAVKDLSNTSDGAAIMKVCDDLTSVIAEQFSGVKVPATAAAQ